MMTEAAAAAGAVKQEKEGWLVRVKLAWDILSKLK